MTNERQEQSFLDFAQGLHQYEELDKRIFIGDQNCSEKMCNFMLVLGLVYNDLKFLQINMNLLQRSLDKTKERKMHGEFGGVQYFIYRQNIAIIHELQIIISKNKDLFQDPFFVKLIRTLSQPVIHHWKLLYTASVSETIQNDSNPFYMIRNKTFSHYDLKEIKSGYMKKFEIDAEKPCVSFGPSMRNTRFYYADAAVEGYFRKKAEGNNIDKIFKMIIDTNNTLAHTLGNISYRFISIRKKSLKRTGTLGV